STISLHFFFQAEDGIRDFHVTGVQTCALPILPQLPVVRAWLELCGADDPTRKRILELAEAAHGETRPWRELLREERHLQGVARERETAAVRVRNFQRSEEHTSELQSRENLV